ncbi:MAG: hypothetical protein Q8Q62_09370 [Mesorhizobium sp.]|nr:hypothetical protein [Mesorhizobium sp.]
MVLQKGIAPLDMGEHLVEGVDQDADLVGAIVAQPSRQIGAAADIGELAGELSQWPDDAGYLRPHDQRRHQHQRRSEQQRGAQRVEISTTQRRDVRLEGERADNLAGIADIRGRRQGIRREDGQVVLPGGAIGAFQCRRLADFGKNLAARIENGRVADFGHLADAPQHQENAPLVGPPNAWRRGRRKGRGRAAQARLFGANGLAELADQKERDADKYAGEYRQNHYS